MVWSGLLSDGLQLRDGSYFTRRGPVRLFFDRLNAVLF